jgi:hypothetical protein
MSDDSLLANDLELHSRVVKIRSDIVNEFYRARAKHGDEASLPLGMGPDESPFWRGHFNFLDLATLAKSVTDRRAKNGTCTWTDIIVEEMFEMLAESDTVRVREEAVQVAAMAMAIIEKIDRGV